MGLERVQAERQIAPRLREFQHSFRVAFAQFAVTGRREMQAVRSGFATLRRYHVGIGQNLRKLFDHVRGRRCVLFLDEFDALAKERGTYSSYPGSRWDQGVLPLDTLDLLAQTRGGYVEVATTFGSSAMIVFMPAAAPC